MVSAATQIVVPATQTAAAPRRLWQPRAWIVSPAARIVPALVQTVSPAVRIVPAAVQTTTRPLRITGVWCKP